MEHWPYTNGLKSVPVSNELKETWKNGERRGKKGEEGEEGKEGERRRKKAQ